MRYLLLISVMCIVSGCTVTASLHDYKGVTLDGGYLTSGVLYTDSKTGVRGVTADFISDYTTLWNKYHALTAAKISPLAYKTLPNGVFEVDAQHFADKKLMRQLDYNGILPPK